MSRSHLSPIAVMIVILVAPLALAGTARADEPIEAWIERGVVPTGSESRLRVYVTQGGAPVTTAELEILCASDGCDLEALDVYPDTSISGNGQFERGSGGLYVFHVEPPAPASYVIHVRVGDENVQTTQVYFEAVDSRWEVWDFAVPAEVVLDEPVYLWATVFNNAPVDRSFEAELRLDDSWYAMDLGHAWEYEVVEIAFAFTPDRIGTFPLTIEFDDGQVLGPWTLVVIPPARVAMPDVTASPFAPATAPIVIEDVIEFSRAVVTIEYDPAVVEVREITPADPSLGISVEATDGRIWIWVASAVPGFTGDLHVVDVTFAAVELHNTDTELALDVLNYERVYGHGFTAASSAHFHGSLLGAVGDDVLRAL